MRKNDTEISFAGKEAKAERKSSGDFIIHSYKEASEVEYIIFQNNKVCFGEYPCSKGKFFPFTVSKQTPLTMIKTPNGVTLVIKTPQKKLSWGFDLQEDTSIEETILHIYQNKSISQIFKRIEETVLQSQSSQPIPEITPASPLVSPPTPDIPPPPKLTDLPPPPFSLPPPSLLPSSLPPPAPAATSLP